MLYNKQMVFDYVSGAEMDEELLEKLEDNERFMVDVINHSKDIKLYNYCSKRVKQSSRLVLFLIKEFKSDIDFLINAAEFCFENEELTEIEELEIQIELAKLFDRTQDDRLAKYKIAVNAELNYKKLQISYVLDEEKNKDVKEVNALGFAILELEYAGSKIVLDYYAKDFLDEEIFPDYISIESALHECFKTVEEFENVKETDFLIAYIRRFDATLADYVSRNKELLDKYHKKIRQVKFNWNTYIKKLNRDKVQIVEEEFKALVEESKLTCDPIEEVMKLIKKLGLKEMFDAYSIIFESYELEDDFDYEDQLDLGENVFEFPTTREYTIEDLRFIKHMAEYIEDTFRHDTINLEFKTGETDSIDESSDKQKPKIKSKVVRFDSYKKKTDE